MGKRFKMERFFKFGKCVGSKGLTGALFGCAARKGVTGEIFVSVARAEFGGDERRLYQQV
jgi:hypothetical protein